MTDYLLTEEEIASIETDEPDELQDAVPFTFPSSLPEQMTLGAILDLLMAAEEGYVQLTIDEMKELGARLSLKADAYHEVIEKLEMEELRFSNRVRAFQKAQKTAKRRRETLEEIAVYHMKRHNFTQLPGQDYVMKLSTSKSVFTKAEPTAALYPTLGAFMRIKYEWKKKEIGAALKVENKLVASVAEIREKTRPDFKVNKKA